MSPGNNGVKVQHKQEVRRWGQEVGSVDMQEQTSSERRPTGVTMATAVGNSWTSHWNKLLAISINISPAETTASESESLLLAKNT